MNIYSRIIVEQEYTNETGKIQTRKICAPCNYNKCNPMEIDEPGASRCNVKFCNAEGEVLGLCECFSIHGNNHGVPKT